MKRFVLLAALAGMAPLLASGSAFGQGINLKGARGDSAVALLLPAVQAAREAARRYQPPPTKKPVTSNDDCMSCAAQAGDSEWKYVPVRRF